MGAVKFGCTADCRQPINAHCHCTGCHSTFRSVSDFVSHRQGPVDNRQCAKPASLGLVDVAGLWSSPESHALADAMTTRLAEARLSSADSRTPLRGTDGLELPAGTPGQEVA